MIGIIADLPVLETPLITFKRPDSKSTTRIVDRSCLAHRTMRRSSNRIKSAPGAEWLLHTQTLRRARLRAFLQRPGADEQMTESQAGEVSSTAERPRRQLDRSPRDESRCRDEASQTTN